MQVVIRTPDMESLCVAEVDRGQDGSLVVLPQSGMASAVFDYYFFRSGRAVIVDLGELQLTASLRTRWRDNHRIWWVETMASRELDLLQRAPDRAVVADVEPSVAMSA